MRIRNIIPEAYLERARAIPILSAQEERELFRRLKKDGDRKAAERIAGAHLRLVLKIAWDMRGYKAPFDEIVACGNVGIAEALKRFDPERGFRFSTYAQWWIREEIQKYCIENHSMVKMGTTKAERKVFFGLFRAMRKLGILTVGAETLPLEDAERLARELDVSVDDVRAGHERLRTNDRSLDAPLPGHAWDTTWLDLLAESRDDPEAVFLERDMRVKRRKLVGDAMRRLPVRDSGILAERRLREDPLRLEDLSQKHGVSRERIRQIENESIDKVRKAVAGRLAA